MVSRRSPAVRGLVSMVDAAVGLLIPPPPGSPSLGSLLSQAKDNLHAPWLGFTAFFVIAIMLSLLVFIGEAVRDAFDPRKMQG